MSDTLPESSTTKKTNDYLANERTFLAWIRTSIAIMGFGFVVVKFSMFVRQIAVMLDGPALPQPKGYSATIGIILVGLGALTSILAFLNYRKVKRQIDNNSYSSSVVLIISLTLSIIVISALLIWYLLESVS